MKQNILLILPALILGFGCGEEPEATSDPSTETPTGTEAPSGTDTPTATEANTQTEANTETEAPTDSATASESEGTPSQAAGVAYSEVQAIWDALCLGCHAGSGASAGLPLDGDSHSALVGVASSVDGLNQVEPGLPNDSYLWHKLAGTQSGVGGSGSDMPMIGELTADQLTTIESWITEGAGE